MLGFQQTQRPPRFAMALARRYPFSCMAENMLPSTVNSWRWLFRPSGPRKGLQGASSRLTLALLHPIGRRSRQEDLVGLQIGSWSEERGLAPDVDAPEVEALGDAGVGPPGLPLVPAQPLADRPEHRSPRPRRWPHVIEGALTARQGIGQGAVNDRDQGERLPHRPPPTRQFPPAQQRQVSLGRRADSLKGRPPASAMGSATRAAAGPERRPSGGTAVPPEPVDVDVS